MRLLQQAVLHQAHVLLPPLQQGLHLRAGQLGGQLTLLLRAHDNNSRMTTVTCYLLPSVCSGQPGTHFQNALRPAEGVGTSW